MSGIDKNLPKKLVTHNGSFHYDEILATALLLEIYPDANIVRTRDPMKIQNVDIVYDVGGIFDPNLNRFDHHQRSFNSTYSPKYQIKLSSAGLIYKYFCEELFEKYEFTKESNIFEDIKEKIYNEYFLSADAIDNGYDIFGEIKPRTIADAVKNFNNYGENNSQSEDARFFKALDFVRIDFKNYLNYIFTDYVVSYHKLYSALNDLKGDIFITEEKLSIDLVYDVDLKLGKNIKFVIFKSNEGARILTIPKEKGKFSIKYPLHPKWRGLSGDELSQLTKIPGCIFVHASGFTGGNETVEGAIEMCRQSLAHLNDLNKAE